MWIPSALADFVDRPGPRRARAGQAPPLPHMFFVRDRGLGFPVCAEVAEGIARDHLL